VTDADLARAVAEKLDGCVIPEENRRVARLMLLHLSRVVGDPHFEEEARLLITMLDS
jgi:hypothetical protein